MEILKTTVLTLYQKQSLFELWNAEYPKKIGYTKLSEFDNYLDGLSNIEHYLLADDSSKIRGWAFTFFREQEDWFGIIIDSEIQGKGFGMFLLEELKKNKLLLNGWVIDHQKELKKNKEPYLSPLLFYIKNGFEVYKNMRIENEKISAVKIRWERE